MKLVVQKREILGKKVKHLKKQGLIPAELYGHGLENFHLSVPRKDFSAIFKEAGESALIKLAVKSGEEIKEKEFNVLIHDISKNSFTDEIDHIDFYAVKMDEKIKARVPLIFEGTSPVIKEKGGILIKSMHEIEVEALPAELPHHFQVDIGVLDEIGKSFLIKDLKPAKGVKILFDPETVIATVVEPAKEEEAAAAAAPVSVEDVKVEGEEKKKEKEKEEEKEKQETQ